MESKDLRFKYKRRGKSFSMSEIKNWPFDEKDPKEVSRNSGKRGFIGPKSSPNRDRPSFKKHLKKHHTLVKQVEAGEWDR